MFNNRLLQASLLFFASLIAALIYSNFLLLAIPFLFVLAPAIFQTIIAKTASLFFLLLALLPLSAEVHLTPTLGFDFPDELLMALLSVMFIMALAYQPKILPVSVLKHPLILLLTLHILWITISCIYSTNLWLSIKFLLAKTWYIVPFVVLPSIIIQQRSNITKLALCLLVPMGFVVVQSLVRHAFFGYTFEGIKNTLSPFFRNHVTYSSMLICLLPVLWAMFLLTPKSNKKRKYLRAALCLFITGLLFSYSRGALLAFITGLVAYVTITKNIIGKVLIALSIVLIAGSAWLISNKNYLLFAPDYNNTIFHPQFSEHLQATVDFKDVSNAERFYRWAAAANMVADKPITGFGPNNFYDNYRRYTVTPFKTWVSDNPEHSSVHNYFLLTLLEQGIPGLVFFSLLYVSMILYSQKLYHALQDKFYKTVALTTGVVVVMIGTLNFMNDLIETDKTGGLFWLCLGMLVVLERKKDQQYINT
ncbi:MAG: O-antigen ligase family protein [Chitinophagaceae bacterium]|nr:O-antigen ligase family protein [Chitinophagaceae bacterium]